MKRSLAIAGLALMFAPAAAGAAGVTVGVGAFGGISIPIVQDDVKQGSIYGARLPVTVLSMLTVEPYYAQSGLKDGETTVGGVTYTREGFDLTAFGANAILGSPGGPGFHIFPFVGIGSHKLTRGGSPDIDEVGYNFGLGLGISPAMGLSVQARGELNMVVTGDTSRKFGNLTLGLSYNLLRPAP